MRRAVIAVASALLGLAFLVLPAVEAGAVPGPIRVAADARVVVAGPGAESYPYRAGRAPRLDAYGFVVGQCTSFVAWWLNSHGLPFGVLTVGPQGTGRFLNASSWAAAARAAGYAVGTRPVVGAIAHWEAGESSRRLADDGTRWLLTAGAPGHVAVVTAVLADGQAEWVEYGWDGRPALHRGHGHAPRYLYLGLSPPGQAASPGA